MTVEVKDAFTGIQSAWTSYSPAWTGATTNPVIGNGTIVGRYRQIGKSVDFRVVITMGSTTTYGSGQYAISLPVTLHATGLQLALGEALIGGAAYRLHVRVSPTSATALLYCDPTTAGNSVRAVTNLVPGTFANTHSIIVEGRYEAA
ncbi:hypothetical protein [Nocardioides sp. WS12]|uniref:hypothetical protein n=1 Tax=Nocardioides sp. WS12 TaxID=2486272 RepID=UPI0015F79F91|nr:hypothetical protein [Nocardioides sp. WS12]